MPSRAMYQEEILDHYKHPHNKGQLPDATHRHKAANPLCGDVIEMQMIIKDGIVADVRFDGVGCAISIAAASMLTDELMGMAETQAKALTTEDLLKLLGIDIGPVRLKCALLPLEAACEALGKEKS